MDKTVVKLQIENIEINQIKIAPQPKTFNPENYEFQLNVEHLFNVEEETIMVVTSAIVSSDKKEELAEIIINVFYRVENLKNFENKKEKKMEFPEDFATAINAVSISTLRGIMFSQFRGTYLHNAFLPVISPKSLQVAK